LIPAWVDRREYPFEPRTLDVDGGWLSYVDEGEGALKARHRCVVPDHLGFGLSDRPRGWSYRPEDQARNLARLIETLALKDLTLVVHDYGGPIGLAYALDHPENVRGSSAGSSVGRSGASSTSASDSRCA